MKPADAYGMSLIHIARGAQVLGQFTEEEVRAGLKSGEYLGSDLAWRAGKKDWQPLSGWLEFAVASPATTSATAPLSGEQMLHQLDAEQASLPVMPHWERADSSSGHLSQIIDSTKQVMFQTVETFAAMPPTGGLGRPLAFYMISQLILGTLMGAGIATLVGVFGEKLGERPEMEFLLRLGAGGSGLAYFALYAIVGPLALFLYSVIQHGLLKLWDAGTGGYETTFRTMAYVYGAIGFVSIPFQLLGIIPVIGALFSLGAGLIQLYGVVVLILALMKTHGATGGRVTGAVLSPLVVCCGLGALGIILAVTAAASRMAPH